MKEKQFNYISRLPIILLFLLLLVMITMSRNCYYCLH